MDDRRDRIEAWTSDFVESPACREFPGVVQEYAPQILFAFLDAAPDELEEPDLKPALLEGVGRLELPGSVREHVPELVGVFLEDLQTRGRLAGGFVLAGYVRVLGRAFRDQTSEKPAPYVAPGSKLGRNDPCPCGSGKKYKKCCMGLMDG